MNKQEIIENLKTQIEEMKSLLDIKDPVDNNSLFAEDIRALKEAVNLIEKQEKMIDLMAEWIDGNDSSFGYVGSLKDINTAEKVKQFFEQKVSKNDN